MQFFSNGEFLVVSGSDKKLTLWNKSLVKLGEINCLNDWVWSSSTFPDKKTIFSGTNSGQMVKQEIDFKTVHGLYGDRYAYRELMTDVIIQHLVTETRVKIRCRDYIKRIAVYKEILAVQLPERVIIYTVNPKDENDMKYKANKKITKRIDCDFMSVLAKHIIFAKGQKLSLMNFNGVLEREWIMDSDNTYLKVIGGAPGAEGVLISEKNGAVMKIFADNAFPVLMVKLSTQVRQIDISANRERLAIVDEYDNLFVYHGQSQPGHQQAVTQESNVKSVCWNSEMDEMLSYTGQDQLFIKTGDLPATSQRMPGEVVGFKGSKIFVLSGGTMNSNDVP